MRASVARLTSEGLSVASARRPLRPRRAAAGGGGRPAPLGHPAQDGPLPAERYEEQRFLDGEEIARLKDAVPSRYAGLVSVAVHAGLRFGELAGLRRNRVNLPRGRVTVAETLTEISGHVTLGPPKTGNDRRTVPLPRSVVTELEAHLTDYTANQHDSFVFTCPEGARCDAACSGRGCGSPAVKACRPPGTPLPRPPSRRGSPPASTRRRSACGPVTPCWRSPLDRYGHLFEDDEDTGT